VSCGTAKVVVICPDSLERRTLLDLLVQCGVELIVSPTVAEADSELRREACDLIFCEHKLPDGNFRDVLRSLELNGFALPVVVCSRSGEIAEYLEAMQFGAFDFIAAPYRRSELEWIVRNAIRRLSTNKKLPLATPGVLGRLHEVGCNRRA
jgi:DNA-binding NtrC family response regulator